MYRIIICSACVNQDGDDYQRKLVKMEIRSNRLLSELHDKEQELINEKKEIDRVRYLNLLCVGGGQMLLTQFNAISF